MRPLGPGAGGRAHEHAGVAAPAGIERVGPRRLVAHALVQDARHIERRQVVTRVVERFERGQERERARHLRTPRFVLQVVKDQAVGSEAAMRRAWRSAMARTLSGSWPRFGGVRP
jgi:hypothetical protein